MPEEIVMFHSALGLRPSVLRIADRFRERGHIVHTPDLYDGEVFDNLDDGVRKRDAVGIPKLIERAHAAVAELPSDVVYIGFSLGAAPAELLAGTRPGARGLVALHGALPPAAIGVEAWPPVPVQMHYARDDEWVEAEEIRTLASAVEAAGQPCNVYVYEGDAHLFADEDLPEYDRTAAEQMFNRAADFIESLKR